MSQDLAACYIEAFDAFHAMAANAVNGVPRMEDLDQLAQVHSYDNFAHAVTIMELSK